MRSRQLPMFEAVAADIRARVHDGSLAPGDRLPTSAELARSWGVNVNTVLRSLRLLADEGLIDLRRRRGATVLEQQDHGDLVRLVDAVLDEADRLGLSVGQVVALVTGRAGVEAGGQAGREARAGAPFRC